MASFYPLPSLLMSQEERTLRRRQEESFDAGENYVQVHVAYLCEQE